MKLNIIWIAMKKNPFHYIIPFVAVYVILPLIALSSINRFGMERSSYMVVFAAQSIIPVMCLLFPMAHFNIWLGNNGWEALVASANRRPVCAEGVVILFIGHTTMLIPASFLFYSTYGFGLLEFLRLCSQCAFIMSLYYTCTTMSRNVTLGSLPVVVYLFFCLCLNDRADFSMFSILGLSNFANLISMQKYFVLCCISIVLLWRAAKSEHQHLVIFDAKKWHK